MIKLKWTRRGHSAWDASVGKYRGTIRQIADRPLQLYEWEVSGATFGGNGRSNSVERCKARVVECIEQSEKRLAVSPGGTSNVSLALE